VTSYFQILADAVEWFPEQNKSLLQIPTVNLLGVGFVS
jgi:hypothetical protein